MNLSVPLQGGRENNLSLGEVRIDNSQRWQVRHWRTLTAAYNRSPFFEYHAPSLEALFEKRFDLLFEWNRACLEWTVKQFGLNAGISLVEEPIDQEISGRILPRNFQDPQIVAGLPTYQQVFQERTGFLPNMSSIDMLFCAGRKAAGF